MIEFFAKRQAGGVFETREGYLANRTNESAHFARGRWLCHAIESANRALTQSGKQGDKDQSGAGFPWITPVLGSGCLEAPDASNAVIAGAPAAVAELLKHEEELVDGTKPSDLASLFTESLVRDRLGHRCPSEEPAKNAADGTQIRGLDNYAARLLLTTALMTRLFHEGEVIGSQAMRRWGNDAVTFDKTSAPRVNAQRMIELETELISPLEKLFEELMATDDKAIQDTLGEIRTKLNSTPRTIERLDLQILTECAWHCIIKDTAVYPGWSDLLVFLRRQENEMYQRTNEERRVLPPRHGHPRPSFTHPRFGPELVRQHYCEVTKQSFRAREGGSQSTRVRFYDSVADVLQAQSKLRNDRKPPKREPVPSAFLTTFDLELEMSLLHAGTSGFIVAMPVYLYRDEDEEIASLCWLGAHIRSSDRPNLDALLKPASWFMLSKMIWQEDQEYATLPFVVRLAGCPLVRLPGFSDQEIAQCGALETLAQHLRQLAPEVQTLKLEHALMLDEYAALQQHSIETFAARPHYDGLPHDVFGVRDYKTQSRFWMMMGVQMGDSGVRYCVASRIAPDVRSVHARQRPDRAGLVITPRLDAADLDLLDWYGFDVVLDSCQSFT